MERRALAHNAFDLNETAGLVSDPMDDGQAETGAFAVFLGREKWLEYFRQHFRRDAAASVGHAATRKKFAGREAVPHYEFG